MKKTLFALMCVAVAAIVVACGGKKTEGETQKEGQDTEKVTEEASQNEGQNEEQQAEAAPKAKLTLVADSIIPDDMKAVYANGDFMPGKALFFKDDLKAEKEGEFPSKWTLRNGDAQVKTFEGRSAILLSNNDAQIAPKVADESKNYLPEVFGFEFDYYCNGDEDFNAVYHLLFADADGNDQGEVTLGSEDAVHWGMTKNDGESLSGSNPIGEVEKKNSWNHFAISFNKGVMKVYVNGKRMANLVDVKAPSALSIRGEGWEDHRYYFTNIRMTTDMPAEPQK